MTRLAVVALALAIASTQPARGPSTAPPRVEGPFGSGAGQVWVIRPPGRVRSVVVFAHGWKTAPPSPARSWVGQFLPWLDHLVARGSAVVFPRYQLGIGDVAGPPRAAAYRQGVRLGLEHVDAPRVPVVVAGYSYGASLAFAYAADARRWGLPVPRAVDCVFPAGPAAGVPLARIPDGVRVLLQVGDRDGEAGRGGADALWRLLAGHPASRKRFEIVRSGPGLVADHAAPKLATPQARTAFWAPLDALVAAARASPPGP